MDINEIAQKYVGLPFARHGRNEKGVDCWGLILLVARDMNIELPDYTYESADGQPAILFAHEFARHISYTPEDDMLPGDLAIFDSIAEEAIHIGMMLDKLRFVHSTKKTGVIISRLTTQPFRRKLKGFYRINAGRAEKKACTA